MMTIERIRRLVSGLLTVLRYRLDRAHRDDRVSTIEYYCQPGTGAEVKVLSLPVSVRVLATEAQ